jgi:4-hydroxy-3-polyprenylbenzoate decarboxylase
MSFSLAEFVEGLAAAGELSRVLIEVDAELEIAEITRRVVQARGPALLFNRVQGRLAAVVTNLLGTPERACRALGVANFGELEERLGQLVVGGNRSWFDRLRLGQTDADRYRPKSIKTAACQQVVRLGRDIDLAQWPTLRSWPQESHESFPAALVVTHDPASSRHRFGAHVVARLDGNRLAIVDESFSAFCERLQQARAAGEKVPVAIVLGGDPAHLVAAWVPTTGEHDSYHLAGMLRGAPLEIVKCRAVPLEVPADAELVIEAEVDPAEAPAMLEVVSWASGHCRRTAGWIAQVTAMTHRTKPIVPQMIVGIGSNEIETLQTIRARLLCSAWKDSLPELVDLALPPWGGLHAYAVVSIRKQHALQARKVANALWGHAATMTTKCLLIVDDDVDVRNSAAVLAAVGANSQPDRDLFCHVSAGDLADHSQPTPYAGSCFAIDATTKLASEQSGGGPAKLAVDPATQALVAERLADYGLSILGPDS